MTRSRKIHCILIDRPVTLTMELLPGLLSGIGSSATWSQYEVDCSEPWTCPHRSREGCLRQRTDLKLNGE